MIKQANKGDIDFINQVIKETGGQPFSDNYLKYMVENSSIYSIFIIANKGFIILWHDNSFGEIVEFAVKLTAQNQGLGKELLKYAINYFLEINVKQISLEVRKSNLKAIHLYESCGFKFIKTMPNYYIDEDALVYRWEK